MDAFHRTSLTVGISVAVLSTAMALLVADAAWLHSWGMLALLVVVGLSIGTLAGVMVQQLQSDHTKAVGTIMNSLDDAAPSYADTELSDLGLQALHHAVVEAIRSDRDRARSLSKQHRALQVTSAVAEAHRKRLEAILNTISDAVLVTDAFNDISLVNASAARTLDFDVEADTRRPIDELISDPRVVKLIKDTREGGAPGLRRKVEHEINLNGISRMFELTLSCVAKGDGLEQGAGSEPAGVVTLMRDITNDKEVAAMKNDFVTSVAHELRTPLASIKAYSEVLLDGDIQGEDARRDCFGVIQTEADRLSRMIDHILSISRIESGVVPVQREYCDLSEILRDAMAVIAPQAADKQVTLKLLSPKSPARVYVDCDMVLQAALNYLSNAVKYNARGGSVTVTVELDSDRAEWVVRVADTGMGIEEDDLPHVFEKFYRVQSSARAVKGTGLGLNLVQHIICTVHHGKVGVDSRIGIGTTFNFTLPIADK